MKHRIPNCKRYQECRWYEKLWRRRYKLLVPSMAVRMWYGGEEFKHAWSIALGMTDMYMGYWWTQDEVREMRHKE